MTALQDNVRDESIAVAKAYSHPTVERRHVLWGVLSALNDLAPSDITFAAVRTLLEPAGSSYAVPIVSPEAEQALATVKEADSAIALARQLATELGLLGGPGAAGSPGSGPATTDAGASGAATGPDAVASGGTAGATAAAGAPMAGDTEASVLAELDALIGLGEVKATIRRLLALHHLNEERTKAGLPQVNPSKHLVFTGDPGTGKTTVAKLVARLYKVTGVVSKGQCVETGRADLVAGYVGQTALKVKDVVQRAIGGVLFIDEAYALAGMGVEDFGNEAIATLVQMMEEHRDDLAVIVAGYSAEMREFIDSNPGLRSRFTHYVHFPNYSADELVAIFEQMAAAADVTLAAGVPARVRAVVSGAAAHPDFGNARYVRSMFEGAYGNMAARALSDGSISTIELNDMQPDDITAPDDGADPVEAPHPMGFQPR